MLVKKKPFYQQKRNKWFSKRWGDQLDMIRSGLGRESENNMDPRQLWDDISASPCDYEIRRCGMEETTCAFCGATRDCIWVLKHDDQVQYMGGCCAALAKALQAFQEALLNAEDLWHMDSLFEQIRAAHVAKSNYRKGGKK
jgi:hypothetical protein